MVADTVPDALLATEVDPAPPFPRMPRPGREGWAWGVRSWDRNQLDRYYPNVEQALFASMFGIMRSLLLAVGRRVFGAGAWIVAATLVPAYLYGFWVMGVVLAWGIHGHWVGGLVASVSMTLADVVIRATEGYTCELPGERRTILPALYLGAVLFCLGVALAYQYALPMTLKRRVRDRSPDWLPPRRRSRLPIPCAIPIACRT